MSRRGAGKAAAAPARQAVSQDEFLEDLRFWAETDTGVAQRVVGLVEQVLHDPYRGGGKPEPLQYLAPDVWARRITQEHRLVYRVSDGRVDLLQARYHY